MNPRKCVLVLSNLSGILILGSILVVGWEGVGESLDEELGSIVEHLLMYEESCLFLPLPSASQLEASVTIPEGFHSQVEVDAWLP